MFVSFRTAMLVAASMASATVAPAQVVPGKVIKASYSPSSPTASADILDSADAFPDDALLKGIEPSTTPLGPPPLAADHGSHGGDNPQSNFRAKQIGGESLTEMVARLRSSEASTRERQCLATAIYFEAKSEPLAGQLAVGEVLANRIKSGRFAASFCGVVMQRGQFSFIRRGALPSVPKSGLQWKNAVAIATIVDSKLRRSDAPRALFFHAKRVSPDWHFTRVASIGNHVFYR